MQAKLPRLSVLIGSALSIVSTQLSFALPPPEDLPEEVLRLEIITEGRSPLDGSPLTAAQYAQLQAELGQREFPPELNPQLQELIFLLQIRQLLNEVNPF